MPRSAAYANKESHRWLQIAVEEVPELMHSFSGALDLQAAAIITSAGSRFIVDSRDHHYFGSISWLRYRALHMFACPDHHLQLRSGEGFVWSARNKSSSLYS